MISVEMRGNFKDVARGVDGLIQLIPLSVWNPVIDELKDVLREKVRTIKRKRVRRSTYKWRKKMSGKSVETHSGEFDSVLAPSYVAGARTGTLLGDIDLAKEPWIVFDIDRMEDGSVLMFALNEELYSRGYPKYFSVWLESHGVEEGLGLHEADTEIAAGILEKEVSGRS
jgi:hypothetical protein